MIISAYYILGLIGLISAFATVFTAGHPVHRIAFLVVVFLVTSLEYILLDYNFLGLTLIIVYCGAIAIIFLFVIMMVTRPDVKTTNSNLLALLGPIIIALTSMAYNNENSLVNYWHLTNWGTEFLQLTDIHLLASMVYIAYPTALILISIALWIVMIAIIKLTVTSSN